MWYLILTVIVVAISGLRVVQQYEKGVIFRLGKIIGVKEPGLNWIIPLIDQMRKVDFRTITLPVPTQKIITKDNVSVDVSAVAYYKVVDAVKSIVSIENVMSAINQIAQTSVRNIVGKFQLDEILSERVVINKQIATVLDAHTEPWGVVVSVVEIKDIELPEGMQRAMAKQAEAEREKRAKIIAAEGEFLSAQTMAEISVEKNSTIIFPAQLMSTVAEAKRFISGETGKLV